MLEGELSDPRIAPSYVTEVVLTPGGKAARIFVAVHGDASEEEETLAGLMTARGYIRSQLRDRMGVRHVPELTFGSVAYMSGIGSAMTMSTSWPS